jgi:hypothetical protein
MSALTSAIVIDAPAERVWQVIAHQFDRIGDWATAIPASAAVAFAPSPVPAPVAGRVCHIGVRMVPTVTETVVAYDEVTRTPTYEATDGMPSFVTLARNRWQVTKITATQSRVAFHAQLDVRGPLGVGPVVAAGQGRQGRTVPAGRSEALRRARRAFATQASATRPRWRPSPSLSFPRSSILAEFLLMGLGVEWRGCIT